jgi:hypothetical protein
VFWGENYSDFDSQGSQFTFDYSVAKQQLPNWTDYQANIDNLNPTALVAYVDSLPKLFCQKGLAEANSVNRSKKFLDGDVTVTINRANDGSYSETRNLSDGTQEITNYPASENPTINSCTIIDSDNDGVEDYYDARPLDPQVSLVSASRDIDGDGVPDANDPDKDNDGFDNDDDAFPLDASEWLDTDGDGIGNNSDTDDDGDGLVDAQDEYPLDANNVLDNDNDGVVNLFDVFPNDENTTKAVKFNFIDVASVGITESISKITTSELVWLKQGKPDKSLLDFLIPKAFAQAGTISLANETNLKSVDLNGEAIDDAVLSSDTFFIAETVATPDGKYVYQITSPLIQESLSNLSEEICNLYVLTQEDDSFECALDMKVKEPRPIQLQENSRVDYQLQGIQFRADNTAIFMGNGNDTSLYLLSPDFQVTQLPNGLPDERGPDISLNGSGWLDDEHVFLVVSYYNTITERNGPHIAAINITTNEVVDTGTEADILENGGGLVSQLDDVIFVGQRAIRWNGSEFVAAPDQEGGGIETIVDSYGRTWSYIDNYEGETPKLLTSNDGEHRIELSQAARNGLDDQPSSGTGSGMVYRNFGFSDNYVVHKYGMNAKDPVQTVEGQAYQASTVYSVANDQGYVIVDNRFSIWDYVPSANTTGDVNISYTALAGEAEVERTLTIPASAVAAYLAEYPEPINPLDYTDDLRQVTDNDTIRLFTPEPHRLGFCLYNLNDKSQSCELLEDYDSTSVRYDYLQGNKYLPQDYYECIDGNCSSGIQNLVVLDDQLYVYFRDDTDGQFYAATAGIDDFVSSGEDALTFTEVTHTAGESEIMASANEIKITTTTVLSDVTTQYADKRIVINFANRLNQYAELPDLYVVDSANEKLPLARDVVWNSLRNQATLYLASSVANYSEVNVTTDDWLFVRNSTKRHTLPDSLKLTVLPSSSFVLDNAVEAVVTDFNPADGYVELFTELSIANNAATIDMVSQPLNADNISNLLASATSAKVPEASIPIRVLPSGQGTANMTIELYAGNDAVNDEGERYAELSFTFNWYADSLSALFTVPAQDVEGSFITSSGQVVEITIENFDEDVIGVTTGGVNYPRSLDVRFMQVLGKVNSILPTNILTNGEYTAVVTTDLALVDQDGNALTQLIVKFRIGE